jgi:hypothetical protein
MIKLAFGNVAKISGNNFFLEPHPENFRQKII